MGLPQRSYFESNRLHRRWHRLSSGMERRPNSRSHLWCCLTKAVTLSDSTPESWHEHGVPSCFIQYVGARVAGLWRVLLPAHDPPWLQVDSCLQDERVRDEGWLCHFLPRQVWFLFSSTLLLQSDFFVVRDKVATGNTLLDLFVLSLPHRPTDWIFFAHAQ
jgi:hypothetical protein